MSPSVLQLPSNELFLRLMSHEYHSPAVNTFHALYFSLPTCLVSAVSVLRVFKEEM